MTLGFSIDLGVNTLKGVLTLRQDDLLVEWRRYDMMDVPKGNLDSIAIPFSDIATISIRKRLILNPVVEVVAKSASTFASMPLPAGDLSTLRATVSRKDRANAALWDAEATLKIAEAMPGNGMDRELPGSSRGQLPDSGPGSEPDKLPE